eukprot:scaffold7235_cov583-Prasinococcus_capsulatus_cf.AAC.2
MKAIAPPRCAGRVSTTRPAVAPADACTGACRSAGALNRSGQQGLTRPCREEPLGLPTGVTTPSKDPRPRRLHAVDTSRGGHSLHDATLRYLTGT